MKVDAAFVDARFGVAAVNAALARDRVYAEPPHVDGGRLVASVVDTASGMLSAPVKVAVRVARDVLEVACACRKPGVCEHAVWLLVDAAFCAPFGPPDAMRAARANALEARTLDERIAAWLPRGDFDDFEVDAEPTVLPDGRAALLLRHRVRGTTRLVPGKDVVAARLSPRRRALVELLSIHHAEKNALVAARGPAALVVHLLREEIGVTTQKFKTHLRYGKDLARPRIERDGERLVVEWRAGADKIGTAESTILFAGAFSYLWTGPTRGFFAVAPDVDLEAALGMQRVPSLPLDAEERVGRAIVTRGVGLGVELPTPAELGLPPLERPAFALYLTGTPLDVRGHVEAVYRIGRFRLGPEPSRDRDRDAEVAAVARAAEAGLTFHGVDLRASEGDAVKLWSGGLAALKASGFEVHVASSIAGTRVGPVVTVDVRVGSEVGWLDTELEFRAGTLAVEIAKLHDALVRGQRWVALDDGTLARVEDDVAVLLGERFAPDPSRRPKDAEREEGDARAAFTLHAHELGRVERWLDLASERVSVTVHPRTRARVNVGAARVPTSLAATLRPYQLGALAWLQHLADVGAGGLLADDMGLGKTLTTLAFLQRWKEDAGPAPSLVVCPTSMLGTWAREAARFAPDLRVARYARGMSYDDVDVVLASYGVMRNEATFLVKTRFRAVVLDEAQFVKNASAETSRAARRLDAEMRVALTGTPVENRLAELWSLLSFANPGMLGTLSEFHERYEVPMALRPDGAVAAELRAVVRPFILRRTKAEVLTDLPPKTEIERPCVFGLRQKRLYDALAYALKQAVAKKDRKRKGARTELSVLTAILRLRQMACDPRLVDDTVPATESAKRAAFLELVRELVSEDRRALVFSQFTELFTLWRADLDAAGVRYEYLDGATRHRDEVVARFQNGDAPLFLVSLKAGGAGLNLTAADTVIHCDPWWNEAAEAQATDRAHRPGQTRPVTVIRLVAEGTIEDKLAMLKRTKKDLARAVLTGDLDEEMTDALLGESEAPADDDAQS